MLFCSQPSGALLLHCRDCWLSLYSSFEFPNGSLGHSLDVSCETEMQSSKDTIINTEREDVMVKGTGKQTSLSVGMLWCLQNKIIFQIHTSLWTYRLWKAEVALLFIGACLHHMMGPLIITWLKITGQWKWAQGWIKLGLFLLTCKRMKSVQGQLGQDCVFDKKHHIFFCNCPTWQLQIIIFYIPAHITSLIWDMSQIIAWLNVG